MKKQLILSTVVCAVLAGAMLFVVQPTMADPKPILGGLQEPFLNALRRERVPVSIYLVNGIKLQGQIESFDGNVILLMNSVSQMIFKHAVSTVVPARNVSLDEPAAE